MKKGYFSLALLLLAVFLARAVLPVGFMPDFSGQHLLTVCSGTEISTIAVDENNQPLKHDLPDTQKHISADICPLSFLSTALLDNPLDGTTLLPAPLVLAFGMTVFFRDGILPLSLNGANTNRGPPLKSPNYLF